MPISRARGSLALRPAFIEGGVVLDLTLTDRDVRVLLFAQVFLPPCGCVEEPCDHDRGPRDTEIGDALGCSSKEARKSIRRLRAAGLIEAREEV